MIIGTTPDYHLSVKGIDLTSMKVYVTIAQHNKTITLTNANDTPSLRTLIIAYADGVSTIDFVLTQEQTLGLMPGKAYIQVKYVDDVSSPVVAGATGIKEIRVDGALLRRVIPYATDN